MIMEDFHTQQRMLRIQMAENQNRMEIADEELPRGGNCLGSAAVILVIIISAAVAVLVFMCWNSEPQTVTFAPCQKCHAAAYQAPLDTYSKYAKYCGLSAAGKKQYLAELRREK